MPIPVCAPAHRHIFSQSLPGLQRSLSTGTILRISKPFQPDAEQQHPYDKLGIDWKAAFPVIKTTTTPLTTL